MKYNKKIAALFMAVILSFYIAACSSESVSEIPSDTSEAAVLQNSFVEPVIASPDEAAETGTITWLVYEDLLSEMSEMVNLFETRFGGSIEQQMTSSGSAYFDKLGSLIAIGDSPDIVRYEWRSFPHGMSYNMYTPIDSYIDLDSELWKGVKDVAEQFVYNGRHYYAPNSLARRPLTSPTAIL